MHLLLAHFRERERAWFALHMIQFFGQMGDAEGMGRLLSGQDLRPWRPVTNCSKLGESYRDLIFKCQRERIKHHAREVDRLFCVINF